MNEPEKHRKINANDEDPTSETQPDLEAIVPPPPSPHDVISEIDDYQERIEKQWESARNEYQKKIDQIMDDFITQNEEIVKAKEEAKKNSPKKETLKKPKFKPETKPEPKLKSKSDSPEDVKRLMTNVEKTLQQVERRTKHLSSFDYEKRPIINYLPAKRSIFKSFLILILLAGLGVGGFFALSPFFILGEVSNLPYSQTSTVEWHNNKVYIVDWFRKALYIHYPKPGLPLKSVDNLPNAFASGFAMTEKSILSLNGFNSKIIEHTLSEDHRIIKEIRAPGGKPAGLFYDGKDVWVFSNTDEKLYRMPKVDLEEIKAAYTLKNVSVADFHVTNNRVWVLEGNAREIQVYRLQEPLRLLGAFDLDPFVKGATPTGFHIKEKDVWVVTTNPSRLIKIPRKKLQKANPNDF